MSIALLTQVYDETRRLSIAGSSAAVGDFRLKKLVPPLEQAGQKAPVFAKVAQAITKLVESNEKTAPEAILDLSTLLNAILYTQGETGAPGKLTPIETIDLGAAPTQATARVLKPLLEALNNTGSGRLEVIKDAHSRGVFRDLRLVKPALAALDDAYGEIADFISEQVLPLYGTAILPELRSKFDHKGRGGNVRRLTLMHTLDPSGSRELVKQALDEGSKEVKIAAIECLGDSAEDLQFLLDQAKAKSQDVRRAALKALGKSANDQAVSVFIKAIEGDDIEIAIAPIRVTNSTKLKKRVLEAARDHFNSLLATKSKDKAELAKLTQRMLSLIECVHGRDDAATDEFFLEMFEKRSEIEKIKGDPGGKDISNRILAKLVTGPENARAKFIDSHASLDAEDLSLAFVAAIRSRPAAEVYETFSPYYLAKAVGKGAQATAVKAKKESIGVSFIGGTWYSKNHNRFAVITHEFVDRLDPRWLDAAIAENDENAVHHLARPGHSLAHAFLSAALKRPIKESSQLYERGYLLQAMIKSEHPEAVDAVLDAVKTHSKKKQRLHWIATLVTALPKDAAPKLEQLLPELWEGVADDLLEPIAELKNKPS